MNIHEYQAKEILSSYGIVVPPFMVASTEEEVEIAIEKLQLKEAVLKIQVQAGGRGKVGGVKIAKGKEEILSNARKLIGMKMVGPQTGPSGIIAKKIILGPVTSIEKEYYLGAVIDRIRALPILMASKEGGVEIEELAVHSPEKIIQIPIELSGEIRPFRLRRLVQFMEWKGEIAKEGMQIAQALTTAFLEKDASLLEINPLVVSQGHLLALDAKYSMDDNALFRQPQLASLYDPTQYSEREVEAKALDLSYIATDGNIGCMVNGAGLAMATMDLIYLCGGKPANFLDIGGGASKEKVTEGFKIIVKDPKVEVILINIFGGIMDCGVLAQGMIAALQQLSLQVPLVVRMEGTNVVEGKRLLEHTAFSIYTVDSLQEAAKKAVSMTRRKNGHLSA